jgi:hypothetical protein
LILSSFSTGTKTHTPSSQTTLCPLIICSSAFKLTKQNIRDRNNNIFWIIFCYF